MLVFTDYANLVYIYDAVGQNPGIPRHTMSKLMRWAIKLTKFRFVIEHLGGSQNVWADMLTRWAARTCQEISPRGQKVATLMMAPITPLLSESFYLPTTRGIQV